MAHTPPPAPDWVLGDDGHWKPPPFVLGGTASPPSPLQDPTAGPPPETAVARSRGVPVVAIVGGLAVVAVGVVGLLFVAVTFLGTTAEPQFQRVEMDERDGDDSSPPVRRAPAPPPPTATEAPEPEEPDEDGEVDLRGPGGIADALTESVLEDPDFSVRRAERPPLGERDGCAVDGWMDGATERHRVTFTRTAIASPEVLVVSITRYGDAAAAQADLMRAQGPQALGCAADVPGAEPATVVARPVDPQMPGVTLQVDPAGEGQPTEYEFTVVVGTVRVHVDFCGCVDLGLEGQQGIARRVAAALAEEQGLPVPG